MNDIIVGVEASVATVTLNRPQRRNALTLAAWCELGRIFESLFVDDRVRVVILTGADGQFCSGADIGEFGTLRRNPEEGQAYEHAVDTTEDTIMALPKPVIAAIDGYCLGGGCGLALSCDLRWASDSARFGVPAARLGIVYGDRETRNLLAAVGLSSAKQILFSGERFDAPQAHRWGLVDRLVTGPSLPHARAYAESLALNSPLSMAGAKIMLRSLQNGGGGSDPAVRAAMSKALESEDYKEGVRAFAERRPPRFAGK